CPAGNCWLFTSKAKGRSTVNNWLDWAKADVSDTARHRQPACRNRTMCCFILIDVLSWRRMGMRDWRSRTLRVPAISFWREYAARWYDPSQQGETRAPLDKRCYGLAGGLERRRPDGAGQVGAGDLSGIAPAGTAPHAAGKGNGESRADARNHRAGQ